MWHVDRSMVAREWVKTDILLIIARLRPVAGNLRLQGRDKAIRDQIADAIDHLRDATEIIDEFQQN